MTNKEMVAALAAAPDAASAVTVMDAQLRQEGEAPVTLDEITRWLYGRSIALDGWGEYPLPHAAELELTEGRRWLIGAYSPRQIAVMPECPPREEGDVLLVDDLHRRWVEVRANGSAVKHPLAWLIRVYRQCDRGLDWRPCVRFKPDMKCGCCSGTWWIPEIHRGWYRCPQCRIVIPSDPKTVRVEVEIVDLAEWIAQRYPQRIPA